MFSRRAVFGRGGAVFAAAMLAVAGWGCGGSKTAEGPGANRIVLTHTENLSGNGSLDGAARVITYLVRSQLTQGKGLAVFEAERESEAAGRNAGRVVRSWLDEAGGKLQLHVTVRDAAGKTVEQWQSSASEADGAGALAAALAKHLVPSTGAMPELPAKAAAAFGQALEADRDEAIPLLEQVVAQAPAYGDAYYLLGARLLAAGKTDEARGVWEKGKTQAADGVSKARIEMALAGASNQPEAAAAAAERLAGLLPAEPELAMQAGEFRLSRGEFAKAAEWMQQAVAAEPARGDWWNQLAFVQAYAGQADEARKCLAAYEKLAPGSGNPPDSRGEIEFLLGQFPASGASFAAAYRKEPAFLNGATLFKSAQALLMAGDAAGAAKRFEQYASGPAKNHPLAELIRARWEVQSGKKAEGAKRALAMAEAQATPPDLAASVLVQLAWWQLLDGDRGKALEFARRAMQKAQSMGAKREALSVFYLSQPPAGVEEWKRRANGNPPVDLLALALVFDHNWKDAAPVLAGLVAKTHPFRAGHWRVLYAWALMETGAVEKAREQLRWYPIPLSSGGETIEPFVMRKALELHKAAFAGKG